MAAAQYPHLVDDPAGVHNACGFVLNQAAYYCVLISHALLYLSIIKHFPKWCTLVHFIKLHWCIGVCAYIGAYTSTTNYTDIKKAGHHYLALILSRQSDRYNTINSHSF